MYTIRLMKECICYPHPHYSYVSTQKHNVFKYKYYVINAGAFCNLKLKHVIYFASQHPNAFPSGILQVSNVFENKGNSR